MIAIKHKSNTRIKYQKCSLHMFHVKMMHRLQALLLLIFILSCHTTKTESSADNPPNVLFIAIDDLNDWLGCMQGHPNAKTPNIDKLAAQGVLFTNAHCQAPLCGPSRASIMTGMRPSSTGIYGMIHDDEIREDNPFTEEVTFLPEYFKQQGYHTMGIGKLFHTHAPSGLFDESGGRSKGFGPSPEQRFVWDGYGTSEREKYGRTSTDWGAFPETDPQMPDYQSADWAIERLKKSYEQPFFLAVGFLRPHVPLYVPQKWFDIHPLDSIVTPPYKPDDLEDVPDVAHLINDLPMMPTTEWAIENNEWKKIVQAYLACVSFVDNQVGRLFDALEKSPHGDNTVIVLWSDHGYRLGEKGIFAKHALWGEATKTPLIFSSPTLRESQIVDEPVELLSIYPTLLELCKLPSNDQNEGVSLLPLMQGKSSEEHYAITTFGMNNHAVRTKDYRYIQYEDGGEELYDKNSDPNEWFNQAGNPEYRKIKTALMEKIPTTNRKWSPHSAYKFQPYFVEQKERQGTF